jgi:hypothetical protein
MTQGHGCRGRLAFAADLGFVVVSAALRNAAGDLRAAVGYALAVLAAGAWALTRRDV